MNIPLRTNRLKKEATVSTYIVGLGTSLALTLGAYSLVKIHLNGGHTLPSDNVLFYLLAVLAVVQLFVQLIFFLHLNRETKPRLNSLIMAFAALVVIVIVGGSMWIMTNLNYHMPTNQSDTMIIKDEGVHQ